MKRTRIIPALAAGALLLATTAPGFAAQGAAMAPAKPAQDQHAGHAHTAPAPAAFDPAVARRMTAEELKKHLDMKSTVYVLDVRSSTAGVMAKGAHHVPSAQIAEWAKDKAKDALIVTYCT